MANTWAKISFFFTTTSSCERAALHAPLICSRNCYASFRRPDGISSTSDRLDVK